MNAKEIISAWIAGLLIFVGSLWALWVMPPETGDRLPVVQVRPHSPLYTSIHRDWFEATGSLPPVFTNDLYDEEDDAEVIPDDMTAKATRWVATPASSTCRRSMGSIKNALPTPWSRRCTPRPSCSKNSRPP